VSVGTGTGNERTAGR